MRMLRMGLVLLLASAALAPSAIIAQPSDGGPSARSGEPREGGGPTARSAISASFRWSGCVGEAALIEAVRRRLGREPFVEASVAEIELYGRLAPAAGQGHRATLELLSPSGDVLGTREIAFEAADCATLVEPIATVLAVMLNVRREELTAIEEPAPPAPPARDPHPWGARIAAGAGLSLGRLPEPGLNVSLSAAAEQRCGASIGVELDVDWLDAVGVAEGAIAVSAASARAVLGWVLLCHEVDLAVRVSGGGGPMWASTQGFAESGRGLGGFAEARAGMRFGVSVGGPAWLVGAADFGWLFAAPSFDVREADGTRTTLFRPPGPSGTFTVGVAFRIE